GRIPAATARSAAAFHPSGSEFHSQPPPSAPRRLSARPSPRSIVARPLRRPSPQCRAPTGTWARRWRRARKARKTASGKQKSAVTCWDAAELGLKPKGPCSTSTTNQLQDPRQNTPLSTPCWTRSTPVWTTWRRRMTTSMPASRNCLNPTGRRALSSSSSLGRPPAMPAPRLWEPPARPQPCLAGSGSGLNTHHLA
uniref:Uncharacterized protein n=1 Tax=Ovis aries TaxID=9940 RepID=A0AC11BP47_SHEEP